MPPSSHGSPVGHCEASFSEPPKLAPSSELASPLFPPPPPFPAFEAVPSPESLHQNAYAASAPQTASALPQTIPAAILMAFRSLNQSQHRANVALESVGTRVEEQPLSLASRRIEATFCFIDLAGFTALTEEK